MGDVIRPAAFERTSRFLAPPPTVKRRWRRIDARLAALALAICALGWILALAGAAFAFRTMILICFTLMAERPRRFALRETIRRRR